MLKRLKRSIETIPRPAYIFLKNALILSDIMLLSSSLLFASINGVIGIGKKLMMAQLMLETPSGVLLLAIIGFAIIYDRC